MKLQILLVVLALVLVVSTPLLPSTNMQYAMLFAASAVFVIALLLLSRSNNQKRSIDR